MTYNTASAMTQGATSGAAQGGISPWASVLGAGIGAIGGYFGGKKEKEWMQARAQERLRAKKRLKKDILRGIEQSREYFNRSLEELGGAANTFRTNQMQQAQQSLARQQQSAIGTGLSGTTAAAGQQRALLRDINQQAMNLEAQMATQKSGLLAARSDQIFNQQQTLGQVKMINQYDNTPFQPGATAAAYGQLGAAAGYGLGSLADYYNK